MQRRIVIAGALAGALVAGKGRGAPAEPIPFDRDTVRKLARERATKPFVAADTKLPDEFASADYDAYRAIRFDPAQSLWHGAGLGFEAQFFHRGWLYKDRVDMSRGGRRQGVGQSIYRPRDVQLRAGQVTAVATDDLGFAGFRLHAPINRPDYYDEMCVFLGASYFRAVAKNEGYGLSSRGLSIKTGDPAGEEFPAFRSFWLERPQKGTNSIVISALLDSQSCTAAMRFTIRPGDDTVMDMETTLYPRADLHEAGVGNATSMFFFGDGDRSGIDDWRRAVHDSDGLLMLTGRGEQVLRQLANPKRLQISSFVDTSPRGFGLVQRKRRLSDYDDLEARYERRPSLWIEPIGDWGDGQVHVVGDPEQRRGARQHRCVLAAEAGVGDEVGDQLYLPPALARLAARVEQIGTVHRHAERGGRGAE